LQETVHVAVGILLDEQNRVLLAKRPDDLHQGGLWEFPGGKVEPGEQVVDALIREFEEEVNLTIGEAKHFMEIHHDYGDKKVFLDIWVSRQFTGEAKGLEGQEIRWVSLELLSEFTFPQANKAIVDKLSMDFSKNI
jgi:8-oxo-dGTP diphosphatase